ncbi:translation initiation factor eIF-2B [Haloparvum sedimenti]|uniref:translation initiation factor eIF-2B n=1 Tax=Haloparvum sedimenti TaxID=1678448 RepID=UPI00071E8DEB|nr:translation initiation factor eIF-2B [Haloparvum sedimenti]
MIDETVAEIREMRSHSSSVIARKAARALEELLDREYASAEEFEQDLQHNAGVLRRSNPSHAILHNALREIERSVVGETTTVADGKERLRETIEEVVADVERGKAEAAASARETFVDEETVLTHDYSTTVLEAMEAATQEGIHLSAYVTEARPRYFGRKTARALAANPRVETTMIVDSAMGHALRECDRVVLGMTCITDRTYYNRIGTLPLVATANELDVPVTVVGSGAKVIDDFRFENEFRDAVEVMREPIEDVDVENPMYDAVPVSLVDEVITDDGVVEL